MAAAAQCVVVVGREGMCEVRPHNGRFMAYDAITFNGTPESVKNFISALILSLPERWRYGVVRDKPNGGDRGHNFYIEEERVRAQLVLFRDSGADSAKVIQILALEGEDERGERFPAGQYEAALRRFEEVATPIAAKMGVTVCDE